MRTKEEIEKILEIKQKEYQEQIKEVEMLSQMLMNKDKKEVVGIILGILISGGLNNNENKRRN